MKNQISIIVNGVRYDAVEGDTSNGCDKVCDFKEQCKRLKNEGYEPYETCAEFLPIDIVFKKSDKKFEA